MFQATGPQNSPLPGGQDSAEWGCASQQGAELEEERPEPSFSSQRMHHTVMQLPSPSPAGEIGWDFEPPHQVEVVPAHARELELDGCYGAFQPKPSHEPVTGEGKVKYT